LPASLSESTAEAKTAPAISTNAIASPIKVCFCIFYLLNFLSGNISFDIYFSQETDAV
jgi:hypothetical protein